MTIDGRKSSRYDSTCFSQAPSAPVEFGSFMTQIFDPKSRTTFTWERQANLHGHHVYVYGFHVPSEAGTALIDKDTNKAILAPMSGRIFIDPRTFDVLQIISNLKVPPEFPIRLVERKVEYAPQQIAGKSYSLPSHSEMRMEDLPHRSTATRSNSRTTITSHLNPRSM